MTTADRFPWTPDSEQMLAELYLKGRSHSEIARELTDRFGAQVSRNASIGKAARMGLVSPTSARPAKPVSPTRVYERVATPKKPLPQPASAVRPIEVEPEQVSAPEPGSRLFSMFELRASSCRYPMVSWEAGRTPSPTEGVYCGRPKVKDATHSYCEEHAAVCCAGRVNLTARGAGFRLALRG